MCKALLDPVVMRICRLAGRSLWLDPLFTESGMWDLLSPADVDCCRVGSFSLFLFMDHSLLDECNMLKTYVAR